MVRQELLHVVAQLGLSGICIFAQIGAEVLVGMTVLQDLLAFAGGMEIGENGLSCEQKLKHFGGTVMRSCGANDHGGPRFIQQGKDVEVGNSIWIFRNHS